MSDTTPRSPKFDNLDAARQWAMESGESQDMVMTMFQSTPDHPPVYQLVPSHHIRTTSKNPDFPYLVVKRHDYSLGIRPVTIINDWR